MWILPLVNFLVIGRIYFEYRWGKYSRAFFLSCCAIALLMLHFALGNFPYLVYSTPYAENGLTIYNASSSPKTLGLMLVIAAVGVPLVLLYTGFIYWTFRGKVRLDSSSY